jgi:hypothetical protein
MGTTNSRAAAKRYQDVAAHQEAFMPKLDVETAQPSLSAQDREKLKELRKRLLQNKALSEKPPFLGSSACNIF